MIGWFKREWPNFLASFVIGGFVGGVLSVLGAPEWVGCTGAATVGVLFGILSPVRLK